MSESGQELALPPSPCMVGSRPGSGPSASERAYEATYVGFPAESGRLPSLLAKRRLAAMWPLSSPLAFRSPMHFTYSILSNIVLHIMRYFGQYSSAMSRVSNIGRYGGSNVVNLLYDRYGNRKYINEEERRRFLRAAKAIESRPVFTFCLVLARTGGRISEVLALTPRQIDIDGQMIVYRSLKKRIKEGGDPVYRAVPVPARLLRKLDAVHEIKAAQQDPARIDERIWPWCRRTAWTRVKEVLEAAGITGIQATPKGFRHGFAVDALVHEVPLVIVQEWLGHANIEMTAIYTKAVAGEARAIASRMWGWRLRAGLGW